MTLALSVGGLDGSLPQIFSYLKNLGIPSAFSDFTLVFFSLWSAVKMHIKRFIPAMKLNELYQREKNWNFKIQILCEQEEWVSNNLLIFTDMCRLMTTQLAEALEGYPLYSQDGKGKEAVCRAVFALGSVRWFILEGNREDDDVILFGIVIGLMEDEYGYISLNELSDVELDLSAQGLGKLQVRQQQNFQPVPLKQIQDSRLQEFLARFE